MKIIDPMNHSAWSLLVLVSLSAAGCGPRGPQVAKVAGRVTIDGTPVANATVAFAPESEVAELQDGRVLVVWRAECTESTPGRKYFSVSSDGGMTLSPPAEFQYDDGSSFYSPASFHRLVRRSGDGRLYWLGNINAQSPGGQGCAYPRYPLVIAEVDESGPSPSLKKNTVTVIDDRQADQPESIEFSNFTLLENRETLALDLYMVVKGHSPTKNYKYVLTFVQ